MSYRHRIGDVVAGVDPPHVEAWMRIERGTPDRLPAEALARSCRFVR